MLKDDSPSFENATNISDKLRNSTVPPYVGFVDDPNGRGTASLVISCLLTLVLCVWSALHLNVPQQGQSPLQTLSLMIRWIIAGIYAPELVVFTAWRQWSSARILSTVVRETRQNARDSLYQRKASTANSKISGKDALFTAIDRRSLDYRHEWTMTHSFFASTGGFAFDVEKDDHASESDPSFLPAHCPQRLTITARGMAFLARCGHLPDLPGADITDKSKGNDVAKALVMLQASWMLIQVMTRLIVKLPVTLLEVNTIAHV